jgi:hypothetical protein
MGPIQVVVEDGNNLVLEVTPTPDTTVILDRGIAGPVGPQGPGDVDGPASSTDNAVARFDGTTGKLIQNSVVTIADTTGNMAGVGTLGVGAITTSGSLTYGGVTLNNAVTGTGNMVLSNSPTLVTPALGTPASGVVTNLTGTASININGTVGATTASTGAFTTLSASGDVTLSGGTANGVSFLNASKVLTTGSALTFDGTRLVATATTGAATTYPAYFDNSGAGVNTGSRIGFRNTGTSYGEVGYVFSGGFGFILDSANSGDTRFLIGGSEQMRLTSTGLGIGTSSPITKLHTSIFGNISATIDRVGDFGPSLQLIRGGLAGNAAFGLASDNQLGVYLNNTEQMRLTSTGLGIGTSSPAYKLDVRGSAGNIASWSDGTTPGVLYSGGGFVGLTFPAQSGGFFINPTGNFCTISTSGTERMRLDSSGNLGIGTSSPTNQLTVYRTSSDTSNGALRLDGNGNYAGVQFAASGTLYGSLSVDTATMYMTHASALIFRTGGGGNVAGTDRMVIDSSGNVGIGTSSPFYKLSVRQPTLTATIAEFRTIDGTNNPGLEIRTSTAGTTLAQVYSSGATANLLFETNGSERMRLNSSGNLGLGVTPSAWGGGYGGIQINNAMSLWSANGAGAQYSANVYFDGSVRRYVFTGTAAEYQQSGGVHAWSTAPSGTAGDAISFTQAMTLDASGLLTVGATSPAGSSQITAYGASNGQIAVQNSTNWSRLLQNSGDLYIDNGVGGSAGNIIFRSSSSTIERARIDSSGNLLVGTTSGQGAKVAADASSGNAVWARTAEASSAVNITWNSATSGDNIFETFFTDGGPSNRGSITYNRAVGLVAYNVTSDYRAKDIIGPVTNSGALIDSVPVYMGKMKDATQERPMFIAHEVPAYAHTGEKDAVDAEGNPVYQQMDASALIPVMWAEIQSLRARLAAANI